MCSFIRKTYLSKTLFLKQVALAIINDLDLRLFIHSAYGKGFIKECKVGPDGFIQMAIQLAYYRVSNL